MFVDFTRCFLKFFHFIKELSKRSSASAFQIVKLLTMCWYLKRYYENAKSISLNRNVKLPTMHKVISNTFRNFVCGLWLYDYFIIPTNNLLLKFVTSAKLHIFCTEMLFPWWGYLDKKRTGTYTPALPQIIHICANVVWKKKTYIFFII